MREVIGEATDTLKKSSMFTRERGSAET